MQDVGVCPHEKLEAAVSFTRLTEHEGGPVTGIRADILARCSDCHHPLVWEVPDVGVAPDRATVSPNGQELRVAAWVSPTTAT